MRSLEISAAEPLYMGKKTNQTTQTNKYEYVAPPRNENYEAAKSLNENVDLTTPIHQQYGQLTNQINESGNEFFGANGSQELRDKVRQNRLFSATMNKGRDLSSATQAENNLKTGNYMSLGAATAPQLVQTGGTGTQVTKDPWGTALGFANTAVQGASAAA